MFTTEATRKITDCAYITPQNVKAALNAMIYSSVARIANPLENAAFVDDFLNDPNIPSGLYIRAFALNYLLTAFIKNELLRHRRVLSIQLIRDEDSLSNARVAIAVDANTNSHELISWSWLYYRFVRVELNFSLRDFIKIACIDERTLRRYQEHGVHRLTRILISEEWRVLQK